MRSGVDGCGKDGLTSKRRTRMGGGLGELLLNRVWFCDVWSAYRELESTLWKIMAAERSLLTTRIGSVTHEKVTIGAVFVDSSLY